MMETTIDDSWEFEAFRIIAKRYDSPDDLTSTEKKRLKELGLDLE